MMVPPEFAWIVPTVIPLIIGLLIGFIVKRSMKLVLGVAALAIVLIVTGYISFTFRDIFDKAMEFLPKVIATGIGIIDVLPYSSAAFLIGLGLGLWKG